MRIDPDAVIQTVDANKTACALSAEEVARVKALGCLWDKRTGDTFNVRVITVNGKLTAEELAAVSRAADEYGAGAVAMTSRLTLEIQGVPYAGIEPLREFLQRHGLQTGGTGPRVRPVVSCKGTTCQYGLIDTFDLSEKIHRLYYEGYHEVRLPHKFKIAVGGCPNNCVKPNLNDLGIVGQRVPVADPDKCRGCKTCRLEKVCPAHIPGVVNGKVAIDPDRCRNCGRCVGQCPFHVTDRFIGGYRVYLGGRWGKEYAHGKPMDMLFTSPDEVLSVVEKAILLFRDQGVAGERFSNTLERIGFDEACRLLEGDELIRRRQEILTK